MLPLIETYPVDFDPIIQSVVFLEEGQGLHFKTSWSELLRAWDFLAHFYFHNL